MARRWAKAGLDVTIGSRSAESAQARAEELGFGLKGAANADAAAQAFHALAVARQARQERQRQLLDPVLRHVVDSADTVEFLKQIADQEEGFSSSLYGHVIEI